MSSEALVSLPNWPERNIFHFFGKKVRVLNLSGFMRCDRVNLLLLSLSDMNVRLIWCLLLVIPLQLKANAFSDLAIELEFNEIAGVVTEAQGEFVARVTNLGPDPAGLNAPFPHPIAFLSDVVQFNGSTGPEINFTAAPHNDNQKCFFVTVIGSPPPGGHGPVYAFDINIQSVEVNETVECFGRYTRSFESGVREVGWEIRNFADTDPNDNNNVQSITFGFPPENVPTIGYFTLSFLMLAMLLTGLKLILSRNR